MIYLITYRKHNETHDLEWYAPSSWRPETVRNCFIARFPQADILSFSARPALSTTAASTSSN